MNGGYQRKFYHPVQQEPEEPPRARKQKRKRRLPAPLRWLLRLVSTAVVLTLILAMLPTVSRWLSSIWPDPARVKTVSELLSHQLAASSRLETLTVDDSGVLVSTVNAALIGEVQRVTIHYDYHASIGIDLTRVQVQAEDGRIVLALPAPEVLSDGLTQTSVDKADFWYPLTERRRKAILDAELEARRAQSLQEAQTSDEVWQQTVSAVRSFIDLWAEDGLADGVRFDFVKQEEKADAPDAGGAL